ncbi:MAG TPA: hypothetical protein VGH53_09010 [Streptosporangiaceae bacterium]
MPVDLSAWSRVDGVTGIERSRRAYGGLSVFVHQISHARILPLASQDARPAVTARPAADECTLLRHHTLCANDLRFRSDAVRCHDEIGATDAAGAAEFPD